MSDPEPTEPNPQPSDSDTQLQKYAEHVRKRRQEEAELLAKMQGSPFEGYTPTSVESNHAAFKRIDRELMRCLGELKEVIAEFDSYRHAWAEIISCDVAPGRASDTRKRLEVMQGRALYNLDGAAWRLRLMIRNEEAACST